MRKEKVKSVYKKYTQDPNIKLINKTAAIKFPSGSSALLNSKEVKQMLAGAAIGAFANVYLNRRDRERKNHNIFQSYIK